MATLNCMIIIIEGKLFSTTVVVGHWMTVVYNIIVFRDVEN